MRRSLEEVAKGHAKNSKRATRIQRQIAKHAALVNGEIPAGADKAIIGDFHAGLSKVQQMLAALLA